MSGALQIDHDRFFKELLTEFFFEFLRQELFVGGEQYRADVVVKARFKADPGATFLVIHVEHQSTALGNFGERFYNYYSAILGKHGFPVYPIVIYSHDAPLKMQPSIFRRRLGDLTILTFRYRVVQLNRLSWRRFVGRENPVASALMSKMKVAVRDRPRVKFECLRLLMTLQLDPARRGLIGKFVDAYLRLNDAETIRFHRAIETSELRPRQREEIVEYVTSWEEKGIEIGMQRGLQWGLQQGLEEGLQALRANLLDVLAARFGPVETTIVNRVQAVDSVEELR